MDRAKKAVEIFLQKYNGAQAVLSVFADEGGLPQEKALLIGSCFGGGMRCGEVCGAVTGSLMALGLRFGYSTVENPGDKQRSNALACSFEEKFKEKHSTIICKDLLGYDLSKPDDMKMLEELGYFATRCPRYIEDAVRIVEVLTAQKDTSEGGHI